MKQPWFKAESFLQQGEFYGTTSIIGLLYAVGRQA